MAKKREKVGGGLGLGATTSNVEEYQEVARQAERLQAAVRQGEAIIEVPVDLIDRSPYQARIDFDDAELASLAADIARNGVHQPITVRPKLDNRFELVAGERRWLASQRAKRDTVPARVREITDFQAHLIGISENNQRANLSAWEKALEARELLQHAKAAGEPHAQRDLAGYLNRNLQAINHELKIAEAIDRELIAMANVKIVDVCALPRETLHRIATLPVPKRPRGLREAIRLHQLSRGGAGSGPAASAQATAATAPKPADHDRLREYWDRGGFQVQIRRPLSTLAPKRARKYLDDLLPGFVGLTRRLGEAAIHTLDHPEAQVLVLKAPGSMSPEDRDATRQELQRVLDQLQQDS